MGNETWFAAPSNGKRSFDYGTKFTLAISIYKTPVYWDQISKQENQYQHWWLRLCAVDHWNFDRFASSCFQSPYSLMAWLMFTIDLEHHFLREQITKKKAWEQGDFIEIENVCYKTFIYFSAIYITTAKIQLEHFFRFDLRIFSLSTKCYWIDWKIKSIVKVFRKPTEYRKWTKLQTWYSGSLFYAIGQYNHLRMSIDRKMINWIPIWKWSKMAWKNCPHTRNKRIYRKCVHFN